MIKVNEELKRSIFEKIPKNYSNIEKAMFIYSELCSKLQYSISYFIDEENVIDFFRNKNNIESVDGKNNKEVVCFTFNAIFSQLLFEAGIISEENLNNCNTITDDKLSSMHEELILHIDSELFSVDATYGILDNNDLTLSKFSGYKFKGWSADSDNGSNVLDSAITKICEEREKNDNLIKSYIEQKEKLGDYMSLSVEARADLFLQLANLMPDYSIESFNYLLKLKQLLFKKEELNGKNSIDQYVDLMFVKDKENNEYKAFLFFNPKGYTGDKGFENFDSLRIFEIAPKTKNIKEVDSQKVINDFDNDKYSTRDSKPLNSQSVKMTKKGKVFYDYEYEGGKPIYDRNQKPTNVSAVFRRYLKTGVRERIEKDN